MHKRDQESILITTLTEGHTITAACKRAGVSRMFYDRHYKTDRNFRKSVDEARARGRYSNDDLVATMYAKKVRDGHWPAIQYGLKKRDTSDTMDKARDRVEQEGLSLGDIRQLISALPEPAQSRNWTRLRELLDDASEAGRKGFLGSDNAETSDL